MEKGWIDVAVNNMVSMWHRAGLAKIECETIGKFGREEDFARLAVKLQALTDALRAFKAKYKGEVASKSSSKAISNEQARQKFREFAMEANRIANLIKGSGHASRARDNMITCRDQALLASRLIGQVKSKGHKYAPRAPHTPNVVEQSAGYKINDLIYAMEQFLNNWSAPIEGDHLSNPLATAIFRMQGSALGARNALKEDYRWRQQHGKSSNRKEGYGEPPLPPAPPAPTYVPGHGMRKVLNKHAYKEGYYDAMRIADDVGHVRVSPNSALSNAINREWPESYLYGWKIGMQTWERS